MRPFTISLFHTFGGSPRRRLERDIWRKRLPPSLLRFKPDTCPASPSSTWPSSPPPPCQGSGSPCSPHHLHLDRSRLERLQISKKIGLQVILLCCLGGPSQPAGQVEEVIKTHLKASCSWSSTSVSGWWWCGLFCILSFVFRKCEWSVSCGVACFDTKVFLIPGGPRAGCQWAAPVQDVSSKSDIWRMHA